MTNHPELDRLVVELIAAPQEQTVDTLFGDARKANLLDGLQHVELAQYFRDLRKGPEGDLVAAIVLRVLAGKRDAVQESAVRAQIAQFLDSQYGPVFAAVYKTPKRPQAFEILNAFSPVVPSIESRAAEAIAGFRVLGRLEDSRERLLRLLNGAAGRVVFGSFLDVRTTSDEISELTRCAIELRDAEDPDLIGTLARAAGAQAGHLEDDVDAIPSQYGRLLVLGVTDGIRYAVERKLALKSPPGLLSLSIAERPLPLLEPGVTCLATVSVTNNADAPAIDVTVRGHSHSLQLDTPEASHSVGRIEPHSRVEVSIPVTVQEPINAGQLELTAKWVNLDHTLGTSTQIVELVAHDVHIDWQALIGDEPYALYPVEKRAQLVGRDRELAGLTQAFGAAPLANLYVTGQRRVGKTSLIRVLQAELRQVSHKLCVAVVEAGEVRATDGATTIGALGRKLAQRLIRASGLEDEIALPQFDGSLAPLTEVVEQILEWDSELRFLLVVDEFDELSDDTYRRDGPGDALFLPMRSLAQKPNVGWLLVGGEKMPFIRDEQAARLNTFRELGVSYLALVSDAGKDNPGFAGLVRQPLPSGFRVTEGAVQSLYRESAGNPHFAKEICATLFSTAVARRDAIVTEDEVADAVARTARERDVELFVHFWEDGIFGSDDERRRVELGRRRFLTAIAYLLRGDAAVTPDRLRQTADQQGIDHQTTDRMRAEFLRRGILRDERTTLSVHVPLFRRWLEGEGIYKLPPKGVADQVASQLAVRDESLKVSTGELRRLVDQWREFEYRGQRVTRDDVEHWLDQFDLIPERRLAFRFLERLVLINSGQVFSGLRSLQRIVAQNTAIKLSKGQRALRHVYVAALGGSGSSGASYAYQYRQINNIGANNLVPQDRVIDRLLANTAITAVVLVDDFIGSGGTAIKSLEPLAARVHELRGRPDVSWFVVAVSGLATGAHAVEASEAGRSLDVHVAVAHPLLSTDLPFDSESTLFDEAGQRAFRELLVKYEKRVGSTMSLGYGQVAAPVVLPDNCPNNAPAALWYPGPDWRPLFARTAR